MARLPIDFGDDDPQALADYTARLPIQLPEQWLGQNAANAVNNLFASVGDVPRYQTWPEQMVRSGAALPGDVVAGRVPMGLGLRREDFTDIPDERAPSNTWLGNKLGMREGPELGPSGELISRTQDLSGMAGGGSVAGVGREATLASSGMRKSSPYTRAELERMDIDALDNMAYGHHQGKELELNPQDIKIKYKDDLENPKDKFKKEGIDWAKSVDFSEPVKVSIDQNGQFNLEDGHHRWFAAEKLGKPLKAIVDKIDGKPIETILDKGMLLSDTSTNAPLSALAKTPVFYSALEHAVNNIELNKAIEQFKKTNKAVPLNNELWPLLLNKVDEFKQKNNRTPNEMEIRALENSALEDFRAPSEQQIANLREKIINVKGNKPVSMTGPEWLEYLRNQPGVKQEELDWVLHELPKGQISKADLEQFVNDHKVELKEVEKGAQVLEHKPQYNHEDESWDIVDRNGNIVDHGYYNERAARREVLSLAGNEQHISAGVELNDGTKHAQWQLPGGENYREQLLMLPEREQSPYVLLPKNNGDISGLKTRFANRDEAFNYYQTLDRNQRFNSEIAPLRQQPNFTSSHWDEPNVLAHIRTNERTIPSVGKSLHIEEIQSDWHQAGRKQGYKGEKEDLQPKFDKIEQKILDSNDEGVMSKPELKDALAEAVQKKIITADEAKTYARYTQIENGSAVPDAPFKASWADLALKRVIAEAARQGKDSISWTPGEAQAARYDLSKQIKELHYYKNDLLIAKDHSGNTVIDKKVPKEQLADVVGKEVAEKLVSPDADARGDGVRRLSGLDLKVGGEGMKGFYDKILVDKANAIAKKFGGKVEQARIKADNAPEDVVKYWEEKDPNHPFVLKNRMPVHFLRITPELRDAALNKGFALFADTGKIGAPLAALTKVEHNPFKLAELEKQHGVKLTPVERNPFQTDAYHGAPKPFVGTDIKTPELFSTDNPRLAGGNVTPIEGGYARSNRPLSEATGNSVMPLKLDTSKYHKIDAKGQPWQAVNQQAIFEANQLNKPGVIIKNVVDSPDSQIKTPQTIFITLDMSTARSKNAKFDPAKFGESGLLKAGGLPIYSDENGNQLLPTPKGLIRLTPVSHDPFKKEKINE